MIHAALDVADLIGRPYREGGRGPGDYDCWGLCRAVARRFGGLLPELALPGADTARDELVAEQRRCFERLEALTPGCLVLFRIIDDEGRLKWHIGTVLDGRRFIHTTEKLGVHIAALNRHPWKLFIEGFYSYRL